MRPRSVVPTLGLLALTACLTACATGPMGPAAPGSYQSELDRLEAECTARGGILISSGRISGQAAIDHPCQINGPATRLPPRT